MPITTVKSIKFTQENIESKPKYYSDIPNLGFARNLILDCYRGLCLEERWRNKLIEICDYDMDYGNEC